jgi:hypothetical protein
VFFVSNCKYITGKEFSFDLRYTTVGRCIIFFIEKFRHRRKFLLVSDGCLAQWDVGLEVEVEAAEGSTPGEHEVASRRPGSYRGDDQPEELREMVGGDPELEQALMSLANAMLAASTMGNYRCVLGRFHQFCDDKGYVKEEVTEQIIIHYIVQVHKDQVPYAELCHFRPALVLWLELHFGSADRFTARARRLLEGAKRKVAQFRETVFKAGEVYLGFTDKMSKSLTPNGQNVERQNVEWDTMPNAKMSNETKCRTDKI